MVDANTRKNILEVIAEEIDERIQLIFPDSDRMADREGAEAFLSWFSQCFPIRISIEEILTLNRDLAAAYIMKKINELQESREKYESKEALHYLERHLLIRAIDKNWQNHLTDMDELRRAVGLRGYAQKDPLNEYKTEAYRTFSELMRQLRSEVCAGLFRTASSMEALESLLRTAQGRAIATGPAEPGTPEDSANQTKSEPFRRATPKIGRNDMVKIRKGNDVQEMKWKKAEVLVREEGWEIVEPVA